MSHFYLDASAWVKKYRREAGSDWILRLAATGPHVGCSELGLIEVLAAIARRHAGAGIPPTETNATFDAVRADFRGFERMAISPPVLGTAEKLVAKHRLRGADSIHLASAVCFRDALGEAVLLVASDAELLHAAAAEGFACLDPQENPALPVAG